MKPDTQHINTGSHKSEAVPLEFDLNGEHYTGQAVPVRATCADDVCYELDVTLNAEHLGSIYCGRDMKWTLKGLSSKELVDKIGQMILLWYE